MSFSHAHSPLRCLSPLKIPPKTSFECESGSGEKWQKMTCISLRGLSAYPQGGIRGGFDDFSTQNTIMAPLSERQFALRVINQAISEILPFFQLVQGSETILELLSTTSSSSSVSTLADLSRSRLEHLRAQLRYLYALQLQIHSHRYLERRRSDT